MFKTLQWIYKLGIRHERRRIAAFLQNTQNLRYDSVQYLERELGLMYRNGDEKGDQAEALKRRLDIQKATDEAVIDIIKQLYRQKEIIQRGSSAMFPHEDDK